jgi:hypothetical protein
MQKFVLRFRRALASQTERRSSVQASNFCERTDRAGLPAPFPPAVSLLLVLDPFFDWGYGATRWRGSRADQSSLVNNI